MISAIVAVDNNWGIGYNGDLLEYIPEDLKHFKELTTGHIVVMGSKTWNSLPKKPLPNRFNIIITRNPQHFHNFSDSESYMSLSLQEAINLMKDPFNHKEKFIIGGGQIYKELLPFCDRVYVTKIYKDHENVDTYFPNLDESPEWKVNMCTDTQTSVNTPYAFLTYDRIS